METPHIMLRLDSSVCAERRRRDRNSLTCLAVLFTSSLIVLPGTLDSQVQIRTSAYDFLRSIVLLLRPRRFYPLAFIGLALIEWLNSLSAWWSYCCQPKRMHGLSEATATMNVAARGWQTIDCRLRSTLCVPGTFSPPHHHITTVRTR
ncbi:hypothetical protein J3F83DRAFT_41054 [Trichoderma novae-zelandiae]